MKLLKVYAVIIFLLVSFPLVFVFDGACFGNFSVLRMLLYYAIGAATLFAGFFAKEGLVRGVKSRPRLVLSRLYVFFLAAVVIAATIVFSLLLKLDIGLSFSLVLLFLFCYYVGFRSFGKDFADIFPLSWFGGYVVEAVMLYLTYGAYNSAELVQTGRSVLMAAFIAECAFVAILINQTSIYLQASRRRETMAMLPKNMRSYNMGLISVVSSLLMLVFIFHDIIVSAIGLIVKGFLLVIEFLYGLLPFTTVDNTSEGDIQTGQAMELNQSSSDFFLIVFIAFILIIFLLRKPIIKAIRLLIKQIATMFTRRVELQKPYEEAFIDEYTDVDKSGEKRGRTVTLRECLREYGRERDGERKFRIGYKAYLLWLKSYKIDVNASNTAGIHKKKGERLCADAELCRCIETDYNKLRYNGELDDNSAADMERLISVINK